MEPIPLVDSTKDFECPLCLGLLRNPMLTSCCGQHFCAECIRTVTSLNQPCPLCKEKAFVVFLNRHFNRQLQNLKALCNLRSNGCTWEGTVGEFGEHHRRCDYASVTCDECGASVWRKLLPDHLDNQCPLRKCACELCGLESNHQFVTGPHQLDCPRLLVQCPNKCNVSVPRTDMPAHFSECLRQSVCCPFQYVGCLDEFPRSELYLHLQVHVTEHLSLACNTLRTLQESFLAKTEEKEKQVAALERRANEKDKCIAAFELRLQGLETYIGSCLPGNLPALFTTTLTGFAKFKANSDAWFSPPFYTGLAGYKLGLKLHTAIESDMAVHIYIFQGEFDATLRWPLTAEVTIELVSHLADKSHLRMTRKATWPKVDSGERGAGFGWGNFISYKSLTAKDSGFVQADCVTLRVVCFDISSQQAPSQRDV